MARPDHTVEHDAYSIDEFCARHNISRGHYYNLRAKGKAPIEAHVGTRRLITKEAAAAWRRKHERRTAT